MPTPTSILERTFSQAAQAVAVSLTAPQKQDVELLVDRAETQKAVLAAVLTSLTKKLENPAQDIRYHKVELPNGYSGRGFDTQYVTPFIREHFPRLAMHSGSGWLTRSIEQLHPFTLDFPGRIANAAVKAAFLRIVDVVQHQPQEAEGYLIYFWYCLLRQHAAQPTLPPTALPTGLTVRATLQLLQQHFQARYAVAGAARLPVVALYALYSLLMDTPRYANKRLLPLKSHTTSDLKSASLGDIEIVDAEGQYFEVVEVKHKLPITVALLEDGLRKMGTRPIPRYYVLTTHEPNSHEPEALAHVEDAVRSTTGCEIIVNGVMPTLQYYLRLLDNVQQFVEAYQQALLAEYAQRSDLKAAHLQAWQTLVNALR